MAVPDQIEKLQRQIAEQEMLVRRMVARGTPTQEAEDRLEALKRELKRLRLTER
jgi:polyhydroxyalkanoate synthesis regulator phasin